MRRIYVALSGLLIVAVVAQFYFAGVGAFTEPQTDDSYMLHSVTGMAVIPGLSVLATVVAALARAPGRLIGLTIVPLGLVVVQVLLIVLGRAFSDSTGNSTPLGLGIVGLHALNAMAIGAVAGLVFRQARELAAPAGSGAAAPHGVGARMS